MEGGAWSEIKIPVRCRQIIDNWLFIGISPREKSTKLPSFLSLLTTQILSCMKVT
jgi:hypothetical protein